MSDHIMKAYHLCGTLFIMPERRDIISNRNEQLYNNIVYLCKKHNISMRSAECVMNVSTGYLSKIAKRPDTNVNVFKVYDLVKYFNKHNVNITMEQLLTMDFYKQVKLDEIQYEIQSLVDKQQKIETLIKEYKTYDSKINDLQEQYKILKGDIEHE